LRRPGRQFSRSAVRFSSPPWQLLGRGVLRTTDAKIAAVYLLSLLESELLQRVLLGVMDSVKPETVKGAARRAVAVFLSGYQRR
jgi:hypothetical protein